MSCIFCNIPKENYLYETEKSYVLLDKYPLAPGHLLVIPKSHYPVLHQCPPDLDILDVIQYVVRKMGIEKYNVLQNNKHHQSVDHVHFHIIPFDGTNGLKINWEAKELVNYEEECKKASGKLK